METPQNQLYLLLFNLLLLLLIFLDSRYSPSKEYLEVVKNKEIRLHQGKLTASYQYRIETIQDVYIAPWQVYYNISVGDSVWLIKSKISTAPKAFLVMEDGGLIRYYIGNTLRLPGSCNLHPFYNERDLLCCFKVCYLKLYDLRDYLHTACLVNKSLRLL